MLWTIISYVIYCNSHIIPCKKRLLTKKLDLGHVVGMWWPLLASLFVISHFFPLETSESSKIQQKPRLHFQGR